MPQCFTQCKGIGIPESGKFCPWNPELGKIFLWNPKSWPSESRIQLKESGISLTIGIQNPSSPDKEWNSVPGIWNPQCVKPSKSTWRKISSDWRLWSLVFETVPRKSGRKVNGSWLFRSFQWKILGSNGTSEKVVLFSCSECSDRKFVFHFFKAIFDTTFRLSWPFFAEWNYK